MRRVLSLILVSLFALPGCTETQTQGQDGSKTGAKPVRPADPAPPGPEPDETPPAHPQVAQADGQQEQEPEQPNPEPAIEEPQPVRTIDEMLLFFPMKYPVGDWEPDSLTYEDVWFQAQDGTKLHGWFCPCENPRAVVLFAHGNGGNLSHRAWLAKFMQEQLRVSVMMFDYRGYGRSEGTPTAKGILEDGRAACAELAERAGVKESDLVLMGRSLGGAVVVPLAVEIHARGLILQSTFSSLKEVAESHYPKLAWVVPADKLNSASLIPQYKGALLESHGTADRTVPYRSGKKLFDAANEPKQWVTIPGGDHNDSQTPEYYKTLNAFIERLSEG